MPYSDPARRADAKRRYKLTPAGRESEKRWKKSDRCKEAQAKRQRAVNRALFRLRSEYHDRYDQLLREELQRPEERVGKRRRVTVDGIYLRP